MAWVGEEPGEDDPLLAFAPFLHKAPRSNSITPDRQRRFVAALAATGIVGKAARSIGKSTEALYRLKHLPGAEGFSAAWDAAVLRGLQRIDDCAIERALTGTRTPIVSGGEILGWWDKPDNTLLRFLLQHRLPQHYAKQEIGPGHPVYEELAAEARRQVSDAQRAGHQRAFAFALAIHTHRRRRFWREAQRLGPDQPGPRDPWDRDGEDGFPELPGFATPEERELAQAMLEDLERDRPRKR
ncbi:hypothetical protein QQS45_09790 [Alteriqipengyuania flavescens]|uniref:hypothetical protein n=1 Tax=Alteriqipengyuania flavescens TaxID=3053610 RepID=UPI0025B3F60A|nr:hypothetical protein [Alteriqipengyuania flavescens]WJY17917.1 hypothetical protein QQW98_09785 [Alteriqipengyuania flavescens]WJY23858.1 hypothetical protein QQS45_09790 [Alteriqipengyuania flavescens]